MIKFKDISKTFQVGSGAVQALQHVNLEVDKGDIFGVIGFSGAGKSTLLRMVNALETPTEGHVEIEGKIIDQLPHSELRKVRKNIGMIFQQFNLLESSTVYENVAIPLKLNHTEKVQMDQTVKTLLRFVGLEDKANAYPIQLSGGQKQRVGIARALATNPSILLCDEATSALDPETTEQILQLLRRINRELKITILFVTHQIQVIQQLCNKVAVMEHGKVVEQGSVLEVFSNPQQPITKKFVRTVIPDSIPESVQEDLKKDKRPFKLIRLRFLGRQASDGSISVLNDKFGLKTNIVFATVTELQSTALGLFILQCMDEGDKIAQSEKYLTEQGILWKEVSLS
ncbi:methionine ABC transporter ATP-binding protein [Acidaminococcus timonensis]|uniref:methionine ABC transporter ATP-binding protein n=1 Tax=Acidaminococcus timonensis TaxID=1871002 RepID=UPI0026EF69E0|nr:ATP-binding cassette domain-containing protein [Acidaminococcus timonensis]MDD6570276.1 ATP-binding cassette domain-containing protein [Acidaminococcus sp.]